MWVKQHIKSYLFDPKNFNFLNHRKHIPTNYDHEMKLNFVNIQAQDHLGDTYEIELIDCPGQDHYMQMNERLSHCSDGVILMYDKNNVKQKMVNKWLPMIQKINENRIRKISCMYHWK